MSKRTFSYKTRIDNAQCRPRRSTRSSSANKMKKNEQSAVKSRSLFGILSPNIFIRYSGAYELHRALFYSIFRNLSKFESPYGYISFCHGIRIICASIHPVVFVPAAKRWRYLKNARHLAKNDHRKRSLKFALKSSNSDKSVRNDTPG